MIFLFYILSDKSDIKCNENNTLIYVILRIVIEGNQKKIYMLYLIFFADLIFFFKTGKKNHIYVDFLFAIVKILYQLIYNNSAIRESINLMITKFKIKTPKKNEEINIEGEFENGFLSKKKVLMNEEEIKKDNKRICKK
jgi:hypothetical protein